MNRLLAIIVITFAILAGLGARAEAANQNYKVYFSKPGQFAWCGTKSATDHNDALIGTKVFYGLNACLKSTEFSALKIKYNDKPFFGTDVVDVLPEEHPKITKYVKIFEKKTGIPVSHIKFSLGITKEKAVATCSMKERSIIISKKYWEGNTSEYDKELTVYHELGHCVLNRAHYSPKNWSFRDAKNCPISIMHWQSYGAKDAYRCFNLHRDYYWRELMGGTFAMRGQWYGKNKNKKLFSLYLTPGNNYKKIGSFNCKFYLGGSKYTKYNKAVSTFINLSCTRDKVIYIRNDKFSKQAVGKDVIHNITVRAQSGVPLELILVDKILNETYLVTLTKISPSLW